MKDANGIVETYVYSYIVNVHVKEKPIWQCGRHSKQKYFSFSHCRAYFMSKRARDKISVKKQKKKKTKKKFGRASRKFVSLEVSSVVVYIKKKWSSRSVVFQFPSHLPFGEVANGREIWFRCGWWLYVRRYMYKINTHRNTDTLALMYVFHRDIACICWFSTSVFVD